jgi:nicotinamidase-related amidase
MRQALIIIDMQCGSFTPATPRHDADGLVVRLNDLAGRVREAGGLVVFVQHEGPEGDPHHPDEPGFGLLPGLRVEPGDRRVLKTACDAFLDTSLASELAAAGIGELIVTGCATDFCVDTTVRSALARGYRTTAPRDGHTTADRPHLSAAEIIEHHNAVWAEFLSPVGPARVCACSEAVSAPAAQAAAI